MVQFDEARRLMDEMMRLTILQPSEKRQMLEDERKTFLDPNLIMDTRHRIFREDIASSSAKSSVLAKAKRSLIQEETKELQLKREQAFIEKELRKFEQDLEKSHPKFCGLCSRKNIARSDDENFWKTSSRVKRIVINKKRNKIIEQKPLTITRKKIKEAISSAESKDIKRCSTSEIDVASFGNIKVTIKDKPNCESEEQRLHILRSCFEALRENARNKRRLNEIWTNIQNISLRRKLKSYIHLWKMHVKKMKAQREQAAENSDVRKIEVLVENITETQKKLQSSQRAESKAFSLNTRDTEVKKKTTPSKPFIIESPAQCRLNAQKEIIRKQRMKLAEQSKIIEELKLKQVQEEITRSSEETVNAAKEILTHCGQQTRRTLIQLMRQAGYRDKSLMAPVPRVPSPPKFLGRMEARAEARRNRVKLREEARRKKLEDERRKEEAARRAEEQERKRLQQETLREAKRMREEREQQRAREVERCKELNAMAEAFYRKYLLRRYIMEPFIALVEERKNDMKKAQDHYERCLLQKVFVKWMMETERQNKIKSELATSLYNRNLLRYALQKWRDAAMEEKRKDQVARDFYDMKLQTKWFKLWLIRAMEYKTERLKNERLALAHYEEKLKIKYFNMWKKYPEMVPIIMESKRVRNKWREIVQEIIPDFDPRQRGVILED